MAIENAAGFTIEDLIKKWEGFFDEYGYRAKITNISDVYPEEKSLFIDFEEIDRHDAELAEDFLNRPNTVIYAAKEAMKNVLPTGEDIDLHFRIKNLPKDTAVEIRKLRSKHLGKFLAIEGLVRKATEVRPKLTDALFRCMRCNAVIKEKQEGTRFKEPLECYKDHGGCGRAIGSTKFELLSERSLFVDVQKIEIQESPEGLRGGAQPQRLTAWVEDDISGIMSPGDRVVLNGTLRNVQKRESGGFRAKSTLFDIFLDTNSIELKEYAFEDVKITPEEEKEIREAALSKDLFVNLIGSISPAIYGMNVEKEALALQLFGGVPKHMPDGTRIRGDIHLLLVGDPGTAKSQLLSYISQLAPRGIYASGKASSAAGLTAAAVKDEFGEGRWTLEAGALVLADMGVACIDELDKMSPQDRSSMHEAMEQQRISVAKAGIQATLQSRCSVLGAANPRFGRFDEHRYISEQIDLPPALLSRFDLIFPVIDKPSDKDADMADHILRGHLVGEMREVSEEGIDMKLEKEEKDLIESYEPAFTPQFFRKYIAYAKRINPVMEKEAMEAIKDYYLSIRKMGEAEGSSIPITPRQLEAFVRLSEASARARLSKEITLDDAGRAIRIVREYLKRVAGEAGGFDIDILMTGTSKSQREQMIILRDIIQELTDRDGSADIKDIIDESSKKGISEGNVQSWVNRWSRDGEIYESSRGRYRFA